MFGPEANMTICRALAVLCVVSFLVSAAEAQTLTVYDDALQNSFTDQSYVNAGSVDFNSTLQPHTGTKSIRFAGDNFGAVVFDRTTLANLSTATYPVLRFWVHGGGAGGQQLRVLLQKDNVYFAGGGADVDSFITGGAIAAGSFREVVINLTSTSYLYKVRALGPGGPSSYTPVDVATTIIFTDDPLDAGTAVKAVHVTQLRTAATALRAAAGLGAQAFTDSALAAGTSIKAAQITELRTAIDQARSTIGLTVLVYVDPAIAGGVTPVKTLHITNLRDGVK